jgi:hypothetical protein
MRQGAYTCCWASRSGVISWSAIRPVFDCGSGIGLLGEMKPHAGYVLIYCLHCTIIGLLRQLCALRCLGAIFISLGCHGVSSLTHRAEWVIRSVSPRLRDRMCDVGRGPHPGRIGREGQTRVSPPALARLRCALSGRNEVREERGGGPDVRLRHRFRSTCRCDRNEGPSRRVEQWGPRLLPTRLPL